MSQPARPRGPEQPHVVSSTHHELRRQGRAFGFMYDLGIRITTLADGDEGIPRPPLLPVARPLALPVAAGPREVTRATATGSIEESPQGG